MLECHHHLCSYRGGTHTQFTVKFRVACSLVGEALDGNTLHSWFVGCDHFQLGIVGQISVAKCSGQIKYFAMMSGWRGGEEGKRRGEGGRRGGREEGRRHEE